jgi:hypothetical protein
VSTTSACPITVIPDALPRKIRQTPPGNPFAQSLPFSSFSKPGGLTQADVSEIDYIDIVLSGGGTYTFGMTSFQAVN